MLSSSSSSSPPSDTHWLPGVERRGLGDLVLRVNHIALIVSDVGRSTAFYTDVLGLQQIRRPDFDRHGAWLVAGNMEIHLIKGTPLVHSGENLIVSHIALDVEDPEEAFRRLRMLQVPFEINVSVPKGKGKAESEGGQRDNSLSQAFIRDPDGYYLEVCNCDVLTDFALDKPGSMNIENILDEHNSAEGDLASTRKDRDFTKPVSLFCMAKMLQLAVRAKKRYQQRREELATWNDQHEGPNTCLNQAKQEESSGSEENTTEGTSETFSKDEDEYPEADKTILFNMEKRTQVYGDICQSFEVCEIEGFLRKAHNHAPTAILLMLKEIHNGRKRLFQPPAYYVECSHHAPVGETSDIDIAAPSCSSSDSVASIATEKSFRPSKIEAPGQDGKPGTTTTAPLKHDPSHKSGRTMFTSRRSHKIDLSLATSITTVSEISDCEELELLEEIASAADNDHPVSDQEQDKKSSKKKIRGRIRKIFFGKRRRRKLKKQASF